MVSAFFLILMIGVIYMWWRDYGWESAAIGVFGWLLLLISGLPWWATFGMALWLSYIIRTWKVAPVPKISDRK